MSKDKRIVVRPNMRFGKLTTVKRIENYEGMSDSRAQWLCICTCGVELNVVARNLTRPSIPSCRKCKVAHQSCHVEWYTNPVNGFKYQRKIGELR